uniref:BTB domain-containing protein n=1 Tax=Panagrolaimus sp. ES5 TaxID=591445 RepID=A0AC34GNL4_9BILA
MSQHSSLNRFDEDENFCDECEQEDESESEAEDEDDTQMIQKNVFMMQLQKMDLFIAQDMETGHFDVTFEVDKKLIYAHKFNLCSASEVFQRQFSKRWSKKAEQNETIKIEHYGYEEFWQFLCFIYSGTCALSNETVFSIAGMAEFYGIPTLKEYCDVFLSKLENDIDMINIFEKADFAQSYSLSKYLKSLKRFICQNLDALIKADDFFFYEKSFIEILVTVDRNYDEEQFFVKVYHWALQQANLKKEAAESEEFNLDLAIKNELRGIICHIKFSRMNLQFLLDFIGLFFKKTLVKMAEKVAKADRTPSFSQKVLDVVITEASKFLSKIKFSAMSFEFIKNYVVKKSFLFTASELYKIVSKCKRDTEQEAELFETLYGLAEDQEVKKEIQDLDVNYDFSQSIHNALSEILKNIHFHHMPFEFLMDFV